MSYFPTLAAQPNLPVHSRAILLQASGSRSLLLVYQLFSLPLMDSSSRLEGDGDIRRLEPGDGPGDRLLHLDGVDRAPETLRRGLVLDVGRCLGRQGRGAWRCRLASAPRARVR